VLALAGSLACATGTTQTLQRLTAAPCGAATAMDHGLEWFGPAIARDRDRLNAWCESVGPPLVVAPASARAFGRASARQAEPVASGDHRDLVVVTWNIHEGAGDIAGLIDAYRPADFVILVQEAMRDGESVPASFPASVRAPKREPGGAARGSDIVAVAKELGLWLAYVPSMRNGAEVREDRGNAILSTLPLTAPRAIELPWVSQRRVAIMATIEAVAGDRLLPIRVVSAHFDNRPGRREQSESLAKWLKPYASEDVPLIVGGDLNTWFGASEETVRQIDAVVPLARECGDRPTGRFRRRLDHLFAAPMASVTRRCEIPAKLGSDHHPVVMRLRFTTEDTG